jgi:hypothetical protein
MTTARGAANGAVRDMAAGVALAVASMLLLAAYLVLLQVGPPARAAAGAQAADSGRSAGGASLHPSVRAYASPPPRPAMPCASLRPRLPAPQVTQHLTTGEAVMWANQVVGVVVFAPLALIVEGVDWGWTRRLSLFDWCARLSLSLSLSRARARGGPRPRACRALRRHRMQCAPASARPRPRVTTLLTNQPTHRRGVMFFAGFFIDALNTMWTQAASRVLGAAIISLFICMRLVSSVAGSAALLKEVPSSPLVWAGMGVCVLAMSAFMGVQAWDKKRQAAEEAEGAAGGPPAGDGEGAAAAGDLEAFGVARAGSSVCSGMSRPRLASMTGAPPPAGPRCAV